MKASEIAMRRNRIVELLQERSFLRVSEATRLLDVSHETIRQDLNHLERRGLLKRVYGGARILEGGHTEDVCFREPAHRTSKLAIAHTAIKMIPPTPCTIGLDCGSTVAIFASLLESIPPITIFTNSWLSLSALCDGKHDIYFSGGRLTRTDMSFQGTIAVNSFSNIGMDICFLGSSGVWNHNGVCSASYQELDIKRRYIKQSAKKVLLMDSSKFVTSSFIKVADWDEIDTLITDRNAPPEIVRMIRQKTEVIIAS